LRAADPVDVIDILAFDLLDRVEGDPRTDPVIHRLAADMLAHFHGGLFQYDGIPDFDLRFHHFGRQAEIDHEIGDRRDLLPLLRSRNMDGFGRWVKDSSQIAGRRHDTDTTGE